jgi:hypothetical protein
LDYHCIIYIKYNRKIEKDMKTEIKNGMQISTAEVGYVMTDWKEGDDILSFSYSKMMYSPLTTDLSRYREITDEEAAELEIVQRERIEELEKEREKENRK